MIPTVAGLSLRSADPIKPLIINNSIKTYKHINI